MQRTTLNWLAVCALLSSCGGDDGGGGLEDCGNGIDDNGDSFIDCADASCLSQSTCQPPEATALVTGAGIVLEDVSADGASVAYTDQQNELFVVSTSGDGAPMSVAEDVDRARFENDLLTFFRGVDAAANTADTLTTWTSADGARQVGAQVVVSSVRASPNSVHLYHEERQATGSGIKNLFLDEVQIMTGAHAERARFSPDSAWLVVGADIDSGGGTTINQVHSFATSGSTSVALADTGASNRFQITSDSKSVVFATNERGPVADLNIAPLDGASSTLLVTDGSDRGFLLMNDDDFLALLVPNDPDDPTDFALAIAATSGGAPSVLVDAGVVDIDSTSTNGIVYSTAVDADNRRALRYVNSDGSGDRELGRQAIDDGFSPGGSGYIFLDGFSTSTSSGRLLGYIPDTDTLRVLGTDIVRASWVDDGRVVFQDRDGVFRLAVLSSGAVSILHPGIIDYEEVAGSTGTTERLIVSAIDEPGLHAIDLP